MEGAGPVCGMPFNVKLNRLAWAPHREVRDADPRARSGVRVARRGGGVIVGRGSGAGSQA